MPLIKALDFAARPYSHLFLMSSVFLFFILNDEVLKILKI
jgi:hypothetical protein